MIEKISSDELGNIRQRANRVEYDAESGTEVIHALLDHILALENDVAKWGSTNSALLKLLQDIIEQRKGRP